MCTAMMKLLAVLSLLFSATDAFVGPPVAFRQGTKLYLEDHIANMIDRELDRLLHKDEIERDWAKKNAAVLETHIPSGFDFDDNFSMMQDNMVTTPREKLKDKRLARNDPQAYCADRCVATGNCDVYEEFFEMSPDEVIKFCNECVLSEDDEPCDVPEAMLKDDFNKLKP